MNTLPANLSAIFASASKIVFLMIAATACGAFLMGKLDAKDFMLLAVGVFGYYFGYPGSTPASTIPPTPATPAAAPVVAPTASTK